SRTRRLPAQMTSWTAGGASSGAAASSTPPTLISSAALPGTSSCGSVVESGAFVLVALDDPAAVVPPATLLGVPELLETSVAGAYATRPAGVSSNTGPA